MPSTLLKVAKPLQPTVECSAAVIQLQMIRTFDRPVDLGQTFGDIRQRQRAKPRKLLGIGLSEVGGIGVCLLRLNGVSITNRSGKGAKALTIETANALFPIATSTLAHQRGLSEG